MGAAISVVASKESSVASAYKPLIAAPYVRPINALVSFSCAVSASEPSKSQKEKASRSRRLE